MLSGMILGDMVALLAGFGIVGYIYVGNSGGIDAIVRGQISIKAVVGKRKFSNNAIL